MDQDQVKQNILSGHQWLRMLFMAGYILASWVVTIVLLATVLVQTVIVLITGATNHNLRRFGILCGVFMHQIIHFLVYGSEEKPFPFSDFPDIDHAAPGEPFVREGVSKYSYQPNTMRTAPEAESVSDYDDIIPSTDSVTPDDIIASTDSVNPDDIIPSADSVNSDDDFPAAGDSGTNPDRPH